MSVGYCEQNLTELTERESGACRTASIVYGEGFLTRL